MEKCIATLSYSFSSFVESVNPSNTNIAVISKLLVLHDSSLIYHYTACYQGMAHSASHLFGVKISQQKVLGHHKQYACFSMTTALFTSCQRQ